MLASGLGHVTSAQDFLFKAPLEGVSVTPPLAWALAHGKAGGYMRQRIAVGILLAGWVVFCAAQRTVSDVKVSHIGPRLVGISCRDGADPTVNVGLSKEAGLLVVSCGKADSR